jgi:AcrR family transcriptional regulator
VARRRENPHDGRVARRLANRTRIVDALFDLLRQSSHHPTLAEIAEKAGVTSRTLLNHFPDVASLLLAAVMRGRELAENVFPTLPDERDPETRIRRFCDEAVGFFDNYASIRWATLTFPGEIPGFDARQGKSAVLNRVEQRVLQLLEETGHDLNGDPELLAVLRVLIDPLSWRLLRTQQGLSRSAAAAGMARALLSLGREARARGQARPRAKRKLRVAGQAARR